MTFLRPLPGGRLKYHCTVTMATIWKLSGGGSRSSCLTWSTWLPRLSASSTGLNSCTLAASICEMSSVSGTSSSRGSELLFSPPPLCLPRILELPIL